MVVYYTETDNAVEGLRRPGADRERSPQAPRCTERFLAGKPLLRAASLWRVEPDRPESTGLPRFRLHFFCGRIMIPFTAARGEMLSIISGGTGFVHAGEASPSQVMRIVNTWRR